MVLGSPNRANRRQRQRRRRGQRPETLDDAVERAAFEIVERVSGDTEAVVALRNALDDFEGSALDSVVSSFGVLSAPAALALSAVRAVRGTQHHDSRNAAP